MSKKPTTNKATLQPERLAAGKVTRADAMRVVRAVRKGYDSLPPGAKAMLRRCADVDDLRTEGVYWRLVEDAGVPADARVSMARVVACFEAADGGRERFARWLRRTAYGDVKSGDLAARSLRFRRLLAADRSDVVHHLKSLLRHGFQKSRTGVDWGELGADILFWGDAVRRRWAEEFFTEAKPEANTAVTNEEPPHA